MSEAKVVPDGHDYDFYRCHRCRRVLTKIEVERRLAGVCSAWKWISWSGLTRAWRGWWRGETVSDRQVMAICRCGSLRLSPAGVGGFGVCWYHFLLPRVLFFTLQRLRGRA